MKKVLHRVALGAGTFFITGITASAFATVTTDGTLSSSEGYSLESTQTINTGFGDSTVGDGTSAGGSEFDAAYGVVSGGNLNLFISGNVEDGNSPNHVNIFIADGRAGGQASLSTTVNPLNAMNGSAFSPGFLATYAIDSNDYEGTEYTDVADLANNAGGYQGAVSLTGGVGNGVLSNGIALGINNTNAAGVNGNSGTAADPVAADAVTTGYEISIPLSLLGNPTGPIEVLADVNGSNNGYLSNQFLPGLPVGSGNVGGGGPFAGGNSSSFNFAATPGEYFSVAVPEPASLGLLGGVTMMLVARRRKA